MCKNFNFNMTESFYFIIYSCFQCCNIESAIIYNYRPLTPIAFKVNFIFLKLTEKSAKQ